MRLRMNCLANSVRALVAVLRVLVNEALLVCLSIPATVQVSLCLCKMRLCGGVGDAGLAA